MEKQGRWVARDDHYVLLTADTDRSMVIVEWKHYVPSGIYRRTLELVLDLMREHHLRFFLTDQRRRGAILHEDEQWLVQDWTPRFAAVGVERAAVVRSPDFFNQTSIQRVVDRVASASAYQIEYFKDIPSAEQWLIGSKAVIV